MIFFVSSIQIFIVALAAHSLGKFLSRRWIRLEHPALSISAYCALGLLLISYGLLGLIYTHQVSRENLFWFFGMLGIMALPSINALMRLRQNVTLKKGDRFLNLSPFFSIAVVVTIAFYFLWTWLVAALPPSSVDEAIYHLAIPQSWLRHGGSVIFPNNLYAYFPQTADVFFLLGLGTFGETAARFYHSLWGFLLALALYGFSRGHLSRLYSILTVVLFMTIPSVMVIQSLAYVDLAYALYAFLALVGILELCTKNTLTPALSLKGRGDVLKISSPCGGEDQGEGAFRWVIFSGLMAGGALSVKFTGLQYLILLVVLMLWRNKKTGLKTCPLIVCFALTALLIASPYFIRNFMETGWPLFPFQIPGFHLKEIMNWDPERARLYHGWLSHFGTPLGKETIWHTLFAPILVFFRGQFDSIEFYDGILGPVFLMTPVLLGTGPFLSRYSKKGFEDMGFKEGEQPLIKTLGFFSLAFLYYWAFTTKQIRFLIPIMPVISFLLMWGLSKAVLVQKAQKVSGTFDGTLHLMSILWSVILILILRNAGAGIQEVWKKNPLSYWVGRESRDLYLARQHHSYPFYSLVSKSLGSKDKVFQINMKNYGYFLNRDYESDFIFERWRLDALLERGASESEIRQFFEKLQVSHLMIDEDYVMSAQWGMEPDKLARFQSFAKQHMEPVFKEGPHALYRLK